MKKNPGGMITFPTVKDYKQSNSLTYVSEFKIYISKNTRFGNAVSDKDSLSILQLRYYAGGSCIYMPTFDFNSENPNGFYYNVAKSTTGGFVEEPDGGDGSRRVFRFNTWYTFRLEFSIRDPGQPGQSFCVSVYVDGFKFCDSYCFYSDKDTSAVDSGTLAVKQGTLNLRIVPQRRINGQIYFDDITAALEPED